MPLFEFECQTCGNLFELRVTAGKASAIRCPGCGSETVERLWSPFSSPSSGNGEGCGNARPGGFS